MQKRTLRFDQLERLRIARRDGLRGELELAGATADQLAMRATAIQREMAEIRGMAPSASAGESLRLDRLAEFHGYLEQLRRQLAAVRQQQKEVSAKIEAGRTALLEASQDVKILEKLHEQRILEHRRQQARREAREVDDFAPHRAAARRTA